MPELFVQDTKTIDAPSQVYSAAACDACSILRKKLKGSGLQADMDGNNVDINLHGITLGTVTSAGVDGQYVYTPEDGINGTGATDLDTVASAILQHYDDMYIYESANKFAESIRAMIPANTFNAVMEGLVVAYGLDKNKVKMV